MYYWIFVLLIDAFQWIVYYDFNDFTVLSATVSKNFQITNHDVHSRNECHALEESTL